MNRSFFELLKKSDKKAAYIGFCDQDDYWLPQKIEQAVKQLKRLKGPALYSDNCFFKSPWRFFKSLAFARICAMAEPLAPTSFPDEKNISDRQ